MLKITPVLVLAAVAANTAAAQPRKEKLDTEKEKFSYALGMDMAKSIQQSNLDADGALVIQGMQDVISGGKPLLTDEEVSKIKTDYVKQMREKMQNQRAADAKANAEKGQKFLDENKAKPGVKTTASGLQYEVLTEGTGERPKATDTVTVHYRGTTIDGKEFDSSYKRNEPASFPLNGVIKGWTEGVALMPVGSKYKFYIPAELAYGQMGSPPAIGPSETLIFEVELLGIKK